MMGNRTFVNDHLPPLHTLLSPYMVYNGSRHFTHSFPWTKFEKSIVGHFPMMRVFLVCRNGSVVQKRRSPAGPKIQYLFGRSRFTCHPSIFPLSSSKSTSQTRIVPSHDADMICLPSRKKATKRTLSECPTSCTMD
jgi:hypothetical protein